MIRLRTIVVTLTCDVPHRDVSEAGLEFARIFQVPLRALISAAPALAALSGFPSAFLPAGARLPRGGRALLSASQGGTQRMKTDLERLGRMHSVAVEVTIVQEGPPSADVPPGADGTIAVAPLDLSHADLTPQIDAAMAAMPLGGGVLLVPERQPSRSGAVVCLSDGAGTLAEAFSADLARRLGARLETIRIANDVGGPAATGIARLRAGEALDADRIDAGAVRVLVSPSHLVDRIERQGPRSPLRRYRSPLLVLAADDAQPGTGGTA